MDLTKLTRNQLLAKCKELKKTKYSSKIKADLIKMIEEHNFKKPQTTGLKRDTIDKFYTKHEVVLNCLNYINENLNIDKENDLIIEPSAGNGAFINIIKTLSNNFKFYDIEPDDDEIVKQDYLKLDYDDFDFLKIHLLGNPPFGRQSSLAIKFIKKSCEFCDSISFILPKSFKKDSLRKHFPLNFHLIFETDLPKNSFMINDKECDVPSIFQIWEKRDYKREMVVKLNPSCYKFVEKIDNPDISFRRVGINAGDIDIDFEDKSIQSHYFIKFTSRKIEDILKKLKKITFDFNNTVGPKSISKQELIKEFNKVLK